MLLVERSYRRNSASAARCKSRATYDNGTIKCCHFHLLIGHIPASQHQRKLSYVLPGLNLLFSAQNFWVFSSWLNFSSFCPNSRALHAFCLKSALLIPFPILFVCTFVICHQNKGTATCSFNLKCHMTGQSFHWQLSHRKHSHQFSCCPLARVPTKNSTTLWCAAGRTKWTNWTLNDTAQVWAYAIYT